MLNLGIWEWNEKTGKPISFSSEMAEILGVDRAELDALYQNPEQIVTLIHPDDREHYLENLDARSISVVRFPLFPGHILVFYGSFILMLQSIIKIYSRLRG